MKIEMGESLFYSWLRHVKECQIVQTNWKISGEWKMLHEEEINNMLKNIEILFLEKYGYNIFKKNSSVSQIIQQAECDVLGISFDENNKKIYAVDVAFHTSGLNYKGRDASVMKVLSKCVRSAACLYGFMDSKDAEIIFAAPMVSDRILDDLKPCIKDLNEWFSLNGYMFNVRLIVNKEFDEKVLQPVLVASEKIADTSELFVRGYQMLEMFGYNALKMQSSNDGLSKTSNLQYSGVALNEFSVGKLANVVLRHLLQSDKVDEEEIELLQKEEYSRKIFHIQYPLLIKTKSEEKEMHYYKEFLKIGGESYRMCCEWFEMKANNDRPYLEKWISEHI